MKQNSLIKYTFDVSCLTTSILSSGACWSSWFVAAILFTVGLISIAIGASTTISSLSKNDK